MQNDELQYTFGPATFTGFAYDYEKHFILGGAKAYLSAIGATQDDLETAVDDVLTYFIETFFEAGLELISTEAELVNGTIVLKQLDVPPLQKNRHFTHDYFAYKVYANGQIRQVHQNANFRYDGADPQYRLKSLPPVVFCDDLPVQSVIVTYENALFEVLKKYETKKVKLAKK